MVTVVLLAVAGPYDLVFQQKFETLEEARRAEYWIKKQKDKNLIENVIINGLTRTFQ